MLRETERYSPKSKIGLFFTVLGCALGIVIFDMFCEFFILLTGFAPLGVLPYIAAGLVIWAIFKRYIVEFTYVMGSNAIAIERGYGRRSKEVERIPIENLRGVEAVTKQEARRVKPRFALASSENLYLLSYLDAKGLEKQSLVFAPSQGMVLRIEQAVSGGPNEEKNDAENEHAGVDR